MFQNQQKYEKAAKEAEAASQAFARVNEDMNATKAQVEKVSQAFARVNEDMNATKAQVEKVSQ